MERDDHLLKRNFVMKHDNFVIKYDNFLTKDDVFVIKICYFSCENFLRIVNVQEQTSVCLVEPLINKMEFCV